jgi:hypothetical protein
MKSFRAIRKRLHQCEATRPTYMLRVPDATVLQAAIEAGPLAHYNLLSKMFAPDTVLKRPDHIEAEIVALRAKLRRGRRRHPR